MPKRKDKDDEENQTKEVIAEDWCFACKDGGELLLCDHRKCVKAYHPECVGKDESALTSDESWRCKWHSCLICDRASRYHCYCCPNAVCRRCTSDAKFVRVNKKYGFCNDCLKLALLVEENMDVDSEGESVDLKDRETYEGLFREYYEIIREKEGFDGDIVLKAKIRLDKDKSDSDFDGTNEGEDEVRLSSDSDENGYDSGGQKHGQRRKKLKIQKTNSHKKEKSKKMVFHSWGSEALMRFLNLIGEDTKEELSPDDVERIILRYVKENKLFHPTKKRKIICDSKLQSILRRKEVNKNSVPKLLEGHFAANQEESEDDEISEDIEDGAEKTVETYEVERKQKSPDSDKPKSGNDKPKSGNDKPKSGNDKPKSGNDKPKSSKGIPKKEGLGNMFQSRYAAVVPENIKLVYLKKGLVQLLCKQPQEFQNKVVGSFVRVKSNPNDIRPRIRSSFQLEQVTGIRCASVAEENDEVMLRVSNMPNDISLSMLSDGEFSEEECAELRQKVKAGLLKKPILVELQQKATSLHEDIVKHWIPRERARLQNLINMANEKGWRRELYEYLAMKKNLDDPFGVSKLLQKVPVVIPDIEERDNTPEDINSERKENGASQESPSIVVSKENEPSKTGQPLQSTANKESKSLKTCQQEGALPGNEKPDSQSDKTQMQKPDANLENEETREPAMANLTESRDNDQNLNQPMDVKLDKENSHKETTGEVIEGGGDEKSKAVTCEGKTQNQPMEVKRETENIAAMAAVMKPGGGEKSVFLTYTHRKPKQATANLTESRDHEGSGGDKTQNQPMDAKQDAENSHKKQTTGEVIEKPKVVACYVKRQNQPMKRKLETEKSHKLGTSDINESNAAEKAEEVATEDPEALVWHISGMNKRNEKYNLSFLKNWSQSNFQALKYKVWKEGQCEENAIPLKDAIKLAFPKAH
ncbi:PREDICTED: zinc finger CCCH domain-containing protein 19-like isoform X2 [Ipomoea nil]|uniref:zinc finger CCCH domain-containing protein 19-like isoform X2 n=2 Tax=Ipomoea nil TaxID=35883 RepID=UPI00090140F3|nr:PREDICTED: zinc finger CCCH domain-containing protein 19-like isoform X2 [Ipomoea nil]